MGTTLHRAIEICMKVGGSFYVVCKPRFRCVNKTTVVKIGHEQALVLASTHVDLRGYTHEAAKVAGDLVGIPEDADRPGNFYACRDEGKADRPLLWSLVYDKDRHPTLTIY